MVIGKGTLVIASVAVLAVGCGGSSSTSETSSAGEIDGEVIVTFAEQNDSGLSGTATLTAEGDKTKVVIDLQNSSPTAAVQPQPAHIHRGSCANLDASPAYGLTDVRDGKSSSTVDARLVEFMDGGFAVNVHKSATEISRYVACGDFGRVNDALPGYEKKNDY